MPDARDLRSRRVRTAASSWSAAGRVTRPEIAYMRAIYQVTAQPPRLPPLAPAAARSGVIGAGRHLLGRVCESGRDGQRELGQACSGRWQPPDHVVGGEVSGLPLADWQVGGGVHADAQPDA